MMCFPDPKPNQHSRLSLDEAITQYHKGLLTAAGLLYHGIKIYRADGQKLRINNVSEFAAKLEINPRTFYKAKAHLIKKGLIKEDITGTVDLWIPAEEEEEVSPFGRTSAQSGAETAQSGAETAQSGAETAQSGAPTTPQPAPCKGYSDPSYIYQLFINSLSEGERESFEKFVREEWKKRTAKNGQPGEEVISMERFLTREEDLKNWYQRFLNSPLGREAKKKAIAAQFDWRNDPRFEDWIWKAFNSGYLWTQEDEAEREQRYAFYCWAQDTNAYEGVCY
jgi:hypothetical protein